MIVSTMTKADVVRELNEENDWVNMRSYGIREKYKKKIRSCRGNIVLSTVTYTSPRNNNLFVIWKCHRINREVVCVQPLFFIRYMTSRGYQYIGLITNKKYGDVPLIFTSHCVDRVKERSGMEFKDLMIYKETTDWTSTYIDDYEYEGRKSKGMVVEGKGMFIITESEWGFTAVTFITEEQQGDVQTTISVKAKTTRPVIEKAFREEMKEMAYKNSSLV